jgi:hypothetical protein
MIRITTQRVLLAVVVAVPATVSALPNCYELVQMCAGCGGSGTAQVCDFNYQPVSSGGKQYPGTVRDKICTTYPFGSHTTTPCAEAPPMGYTRTTCPTDDGISCCDVKGMGTVQVIGTITAPGIGCLGSGTGG